jgi:hypothetical protein
VKLARAPGAADHDPLGAAGAGEAQDGGVLALVEAQVQPQGPGAVEQPEPRHVAADAGHEPGPVVCVGHLQLRVAAGVTAELGADVAGPVPDDELVGLHHLVGRRTPAGVVLPRSFATHRSSSCE